MCNHLTDFNKLEKLELIIVGDLYREYKLSFDSIKDLSNLQEIKPYFDSPFNYKDE